MSQVGGRSKRQPGVEVLELVSQASKGANEVWYGRAKVVVKPNHHGTAMVANEFICARLAIGLGLPVPMGDAALLDDKQAWVSAEIALDGVVLPDADRSVLAGEAPADLAGICVFDVWVANYDRSIENVLYHPTVGLWAIDHEHSLAGPQLLPQRLKATAGNSTYWKLVDPSELNSAHLLEWCERVRTLPPGLIMSTLREAQARRLIDGSQREALQAFLSERARMIAHLLASSIGEEHVPWLNDGPAGT